MIVAEDSNLIIWRGH